MTENGKFSKCSPWRERGFRATIEAMLPAVRGTCHMLLLNRLLFTILAFAGLATPAFAWVPVEQIKTYPISGKTGAGLYRSIGVEGPVISGGRRTIAHTTFKLTWRRNYQNKNGNCVLASARPKLTIIYTLPKPRGALSDSVAAGWKRFYDGIAAHERVHGEHIIAMVKAIKAVSTGLSAQNDADCNKVRAKLQTHLKRLSNWQRQSGRDFDKKDMGSGGSIPQLVLGLIKSY